MYIKKENQVQTRGFEASGSKSFLEVADEGLFMLMLPERASVVHTRTVNWEQYTNFGYELKFP
jgi:hypothetical protein